MSLEGVRSPFAFTRPGEDSQSIRAPGPSSCVSTMPFTPRPAALRRRRCELGFVIQHETRSSCVEGSGTAQHPQSPHGSVGTKLRRFDRPRSVEHGVSYREANEQTDARVPVGDSVICANPRVGIIAVWRSPNPHEPERPCADSAGGLDKSFPFDALFDSASQLWIRQENPGVDRLPLTSHRGVTALCRTGNGLRGEGSHLSRPLTRVDATRACPRVGPVTGRWIGTLDQAMRSALEPSK